MRRVALAFAFAFALALALALTLTFARDSAAASAGTSTSAAATAGPSTATPLSVDRDARLRDQGAKKDLSGVSPESSCTPLHVGSPAEDAIRCRGIEYVARGNELYRVLGRAQLFVVRNERAASVLDVIRASLRSTPKAARTSSISTFRSRPIACPRRSATQQARTAATRRSGEAVIRRTTEAVGSSARRLLDFDRTLVTRACPALGRYDWSALAHRFVKAAAAMR